MDAVTRWAHALGRWAIPVAILDAADDSPWVLPRQVFVRRAEGQLAAPSGATYAAALAALERPGRVLDIGAAAGASSLPLAAEGRARHLTAIDADAALLEAFAAGAHRLGVPARTVLGQWPDVAGQTEVADLAVCGNVLYNVADLAPFVAALTASAHRVVVELAERHPLTELNPMWRRFHGLVRPEGPTADDCVATLRELGIRPTVVRWRRPPEAEYATFAELVDVTRRRLCLPPDAERDVERALRDLGHDPALPPDLGSSGRALVTLSWDGLPPA